MKKRKETKDDYQRNMHMDSWIKIKALREEWGALL